MSLAHKRKGAPRHQGELDRWMVYTTLDQFVYKLVASLATHEEFRSDSFGLASMQPQIKIRSNGAAIAITALLLEQTIDRFANRIFPFRKSFDKSPSHLTREPQEATPHRSQGSRAPSIGHVEL